MVKLDSKAKKTRKVSNKVELSTDLVKEAEEIKKEIKRVFFL